MYTSTLTALVSLAGLTRLTLAFPVAQVLSGSLQTPISNLPSGFPMTLAPTAVLTSTETEILSNPTPAATLDPTDPNPFIPPGPDDERGPCPALNMLANHGFLPRNGKNIDRTLLQQSIFSALNVDFTVTDKPATNAFNVCSNVTGQTCTTLGLSVLSAPHMFEHDHSFSRQDFLESYSGTFPCDNHSFNQTIMDSSLAPLNGGTHMNISQMSEIRLLRESEQYQADTPGWFTLNVGTTLTEAAFIFALMRDPTLPDYQTNPQVRVDWWQYWFQNERLPTQLGWQKPTPAIAGPFVSSVSSAIRTMSATMTPSVLPVSPFKRDMTHTTTGLTGASGAVPTSIADVMARSNPAPAVATPAGFGMPNPYADTLTSEEWGSLGMKMAAHENSVGA